MALDRVFVYTFVHRQPCLAGAYANRDGVGYFQYAPQYVARPDAYPLDPTHLPLSNQVYKSGLDGGHFGALLDCRAQEWGRIIQNALDARKLRERRRMGLDTAEDFPERLQCQHELMVYGSGFGAGGLRFHAKADAAAGHLQPVRLPHGAIVTSSFNLRRMAVVLNAVHEGRPLPLRCQELLVPGMSLGGARPKGLVEHEGDVWIAKFARPQEIYDLPRAEHAINRLADHAGLRLAESRLVPVRVGKGERGVFLSRRFDRDPDGTPLHYLSAATLLGASRLPPSADAPVPASHSYSYMAIADLCRQFSVNPRADTQELFRRMVFNVMAGNRDDHLCNHGFLRDADSNRYRLAPAFDIALDPLFIGSPNHSIQVGAEGRIGRLSNVLSCHEDFGFGSRAAAVKVLVEVAKVVDHWRTLFRSKECQVRSEDARWIERLIMPEASAQVALLKGPPAAAAA